MGSRDVGSLQIRIHKQMNIEEKYTQTMLLTKLSSHEPNNTL